MFQHLTLAYALQLLSNIWLKSHMKGRDMPSSTPPGVQILSLYQIWCLENFSTSWTNIILAKMSLLGYILKLHTDADISPTTLLPTAFWILLHPVIKIRNVDTKLNSKLIEDLNVKTWNNRQKSLEWAIFSWTHLRQEKQ